ncbi:MAG: outer membrane protein assembly factor [Deltaproteobacteria bacterium]|nr:MAG: outer membrane protein assembly factor [Deltaproteobacteria bacterium]
MHRLRLTAILVLVSAAIQGETCAHAQPLIPGQRVVRVTFAGNVPEDLYPLVEVHAGEPLSPQAVRRSVKLLFHTGLFGQVQVLAKSAPGGIELVFKFFPIKRVEKVVLYGCDEIPAESLRRLFRLRRGDEFDEGRMQATRLEILNYYRLHGFRRTRVVADVDESARNRVVVSYYIKEGPPTRASAFWFKGARNLDTAVLSGIAGVEVGDVVDTELLEQARARLEKGLRKRGYLTAAVTLEPVEIQLDALWEVVVFELKLGPSYDVEFKGNLHVTAEQLRELLQRQVLESGLELSLVAEKITAHYRKLGYFHVRVGWKETKKGKWLRRLVFFVDEGPRVTVAGVEFAGAKAFAPELLRGYIYNSLLEQLEQKLVNQRLDRGDLDMLGGGTPWRLRKRTVDLFQGWILDPLPQSVFWPESYRDALDRITDLYHSSGYLQVRLDEPLLYFGGDGSSLFVTVPVTEGVRTAVDAISFGGNQEISAAELLGVIEANTGLLKSGQPLNLYAVEKLRRTLLDYYAGKGYIYCKISSRLLFSPDRTKAEVYFEIEEGPRVTVGRVLVRGNIVTRDEVFDDLITFERGSVFSPQQARQLRQRLENLGIFDGVDVRLIEPEVVAPEKDVVVEVREKLAHSLSLGPGISSADGLRLQIDYTHRNLLGYAIELQARGKVNYLVFYPLYPQWEERYKRMSFWEGLEGYGLVGLHWPHVWFAEADLSARIDLMGLQDHAISHDLAKVSFTPGLDWRISRKLSVSAETELEFDRLGCIGGECGGPSYKYFRYDEGSLLLACLRPRISLDLRDNIFRPHEGLLVSFWAELAGNLLADKEVLYLKLSSTFSGYVPLGRYFTLALSVQAGTIFNLTSGSHTPSHKLFWLGGRTTVRGFGEEGLIPPDQVNPDDPSTPCVPVEENGEQKCVSLGGTVMLVLKSELRFPLAGDWLEGAVFLDLGNLWVRPENFLPYDLRPSAGAGIRFITPVGPLAFDLAFNLAPDQARREQAWFLHFNVGIF